MGKSKENYATLGLSGKVGKVFVFRQRAGKTIVAKVPTTSTKPPTPKQKAQHGKFTQAAAYAKNALLDPTLKEAYTLEAKKRQDVSAYNMAMTDYLRPPQINTIDISQYKGESSGEKIYVEAGDAFKVKNLHINIEKSGGSKLEDGQATLKEGRWEYTTSSINSAITGTKIIATATDRPGNTTTKEITL